MDKATIQLNSDLRWVRIENAIFILDLQCGEYFALSPEYVDAWLAFAGAVDNSSVQQEVLANLQTTLEKRGWLAAEPAPRPAAVTKAFKPRTYFPTACAIASLSRCMISLRLVGFARTYRNVQRSASQTAPAGNAPDLDRALAAFQRVEAFFFSSKGLEDCLQRSLALFVYLRHCGVPATHHIGVRRYPFGAHAWVESQGTRLQCAITHGKVQSYAAIGLPEFTDIAVIT
jgi:hypothetical protein